MQAYSRKLAVRITAVSLAVAALAGVAAGLLARDKGEDTMVAQTVADAQRLLSQEAYRPEGMLATRNAQAAARALAASHFDTVQIYTPGGLLMAEQRSPMGRALQSTLLAGNGNGARAYTQPWYERRWLPDGRQLLRIFLPLRGDGQSLAGYLEGARLLPEWQRRRLDDDARRTGLLVALAVVLSGMVLYPAVLRLNGENQRRQRELLESHIAMMEALGRAIARCDADNELHNVRVAWIAATLAEAVGLQGRRMQELIVGSFLHDVGKIGLPEHILLKPIPLSEEEMRVMRTHVGRGESIVGEAGWLGGGQVVVAGHHERWDGNGYPRGLAGAEIPLAARIFAIADTFDALCSRRPYKDPLPLAQALQVLDEGAGKQFDPQLVQVFASRASAVYHALADVDEEQLRERLQRMVRKHFTR